MTCDIQYSGASRVLVAGAACATMALVLSMPLASRWQVLLLLWILLVACRSLRRLAEVRAVRVDEGGVVEVLDAGRWRTGRLLPGSVALPWLTVVRWRPSGSWFARAVLLLPLMVDAEAFRALRVAVRWARFSGEGRQRVTQAS